jgi:hypothetical protein
VCGSRVCILGIAPVKYGGGYEGVRVGGRRWRAWLWRRPLRAWKEEQLQECSLLLSNLVLQPQIADQWLWQYDLGGGYSVRSTYDLVTRMEAPEEVLTTELLWPKQVP